MSTRKEREEFWRIFRERAPLVTWCTNCNVPVLRSMKCGKCGEDTIVVENIAYPRDVRLAFERDIEEIRRSIEKYCGVKPSNLDKLVRPDEIVLLNKIQHIDAADEIIAHGVVIGARYFNIEKREWEFRPVYTGVKLIVEEKLGYYAILKEDDVEEGEYVDRSIIAEGDIPSQDRAYIPFKTKSGFYGLAQLRGNKIRIVKLFRKVSDIEFTRKSSNIDTLIEANIQDLEQLEKLSLNVLNETLRKYSDCLVMVTYSGGKDSTVVSYLASEAGVRHFVYCDTTLDFPETYDTVNRLSKIVNIEQVQADRKVFEKLLDALGPPGRDFRWCTTVCKLLPLKRYIRSIAGDRKVVSITGQRLFESPQRALAGYETKVVGPNPADLIVSPLYDWCALEVEMYIMYRKLPLNELYRLGFERVGCFMCPTLRLAEIKIIEETHPDLWKWWYDKLRRFRRKYKLPEQWITYGLWRWRFEIPGDYASYLRSVGVPYEVSLINPATSVLNVQVNRVNNEAKIEYVILNLDKIDFNRLLGFLPVLSREHKFEGNTLKIYTKTSTIYISEAGRVLVWSKDLEIAQYIAEVVLKIIYLVHHCVKCGECVQACTRQALDISEGYPKVVDLEKCDLCKECIKACPISKFYGILFSKEVEQKLV